MLRKTIGQKLETDDTPVRICKNLKSFSLYCVLNSNSNSQLQADKYSKYNFLAGIDRIETLQCDGDPFRALQNFYDKKSDWLFGYLSYDLKNKIEDLSSNNPDKLEFPEITFFQPRYVLSILKDEIYLEYLPDHNTEEQATSFLQSLLEPQVIDSHFTETIDLLSNFNKSEYIKTINVIQEHIQKGDIYEMNFCTEFFAHDASINPIDVYERMNFLSPMPFSALFRDNDHYALCGSPERFIAKRADKIISQPIKGTARRSENREEDEKLIEQLKHDPKERAENVMIVDLVRNDLSRTAEKGSVIVEELFGISSFRNLHQMISTITSKIKPGTDITEVIRHAFPMGSMTGAPKVRAMELIEEFETSKRGLYSGSIGYISPDGDFDFNVVIRSILYNSKTSTLSYMVGSAITAAANPEQEYYECMLKAETMKKALSLAAKPSVS